MLSIGKLRGGGAAAAYYENQVASGREDYYSGDGEAAGTWMGQGAASTGRSGDLEKGDLAVLLNGAGLRRAPSEKAIAGFDLTFRAPKSVSVIWAIGEPELARELREAHDAAVRGALGYLERNACKARRGRDGVIQVQGGGFIAAAYRHRTSRAEDPLLHTHLIVGNLTRGPDGRWTALDGRHLYRHAKAAGYLYQAVLRDELTRRLGVEWTIVENGTAEILGVNRHVIEHFSRRRLEIIEELERRGLTSARAAQVATLATRTPKAASVDLTRLREQWQARAAELGLDERHLARLLERRLDVNHATDPRIDIERETEHDSTFGRPDLVQRVASAHRAGATARDIEEKVDALRATSDVIPVGARPAQAGLTEPRYTTPGLLDAERRLLAHAVDERVGPSATPPAVEAATARRPLLDDDQRAMVEGLTLSSSALAVVKAPAGTGKTFALDAAREAWEGSGVTVMGVALSARAATELGSQASMPTATIAQLEGAIGRGDAVPVGSVLVVDEAGMVGTRALARLADHVAAREAKLVLVGDDRQLPEIEAGGAFSTLASRPGTLELRAVHRQREQWDRDALGQLRARDVEQWATAYVERHRVVVADGADAARERLVEDWARAQGDGDTLMLASRRADVAELNALARERLKRAGRLAENEVSFGDRNFAVGDAVVITRTDRRLGLTNGRRGVVAATAWHGIEVRPAGGGSDIYVRNHDLEAGAVEHGYALTVHRAQGATVDRTFVLADDTVYREWAYTALSRHRDSARLYVAVDALAGDVDLPVGDPVDGLVRLVSRSRAKEMAMLDAPHVEVAQLGLVDGIDHDLDITR